MHVQITKLGFSWRNDWKQLRSALGDTLTRRPQCMVDLQLAFDAVGGPSCGLAQVVADRGLNA